MPVRDEAIVELFFRRDERAIDETKSRYGPYCTKIASGLLGTAEDAEECVQDALLAVWEAIPPARPGALRVFLGRAISEWLDKLPEGDRVLFVRRYWYAVSVEALARERGGRANTVAQRLRRLRMALREFLKERGVADEG